MKQIAVVFEQNLPLAAACLAHLRLKYSDLALQLWAMPQAGVDLFQRLLTVRFNAVRFVSRKAYFQQHKFFELELKVLAQPEGDWEQWSVSEELGLILIPEEVQITEAGFDVSFLDRQLEMLETAATRGCQLLEADLEAAITLAQKTFADFCSLEQGVAEFRRQIWPELVNTGFPGEGFEPWWQRQAETYRYAFALKLWQFQAERICAPELKHLIQQVCQQPEIELQGHLNLLLFKREYADQSWSLAQLPPEFQALYASFRQQLKGTIKLLRPVDEFKVTFLVLTYNRVELLKRTVKSILTQSCDQWEMLIVDGGSKDATPDYGRALAQQNQKIRYLYADLPKGHEGIRASIQMAIENAETEWVALVPDDDYFEPQYLEKVRAVCLEQPWAGMVFASYGIHDALWDAKISSTFGPFQPQAGLIDRDLLLQLESVLGLCPQGCLHRRQILQSYGMDLIFHPPERPTYIGWDYIIAVYLMAYYEVGHVPEMLFNITVAPTTAISGGDTSRGLVYSLAEILRDYQDVFERPYPELLYQRFRQIIQHHLQHHFSQGLNHTDEATYQDWLAEKLPIWRHFVSLESLRAETCSLHVQPRFPVS